MPPDANLKQANAFFRAERENDGVQGTTGPCGVWGGAPDINMQNAEAFCGRLGVRCIYVT